jgi:hypothetical protein
MASERAFAARHLCGGQSRASIASHRHLAYCPAPGGWNDAQIMMGIGAVLLYSQYSFARATARANA